MRSIQLALYSVFFAGGVAALIFQIAWQRILSLHAGMDLFSVTTVVAAFMGGLGIGNLLGGSIADRLNPRRAILAYALAELLTGSFGWFSIWLLYTQYPTFSPYLHNNASAFLFHFILLCIPTTLMGATLPLLSRGVVRRNSDIAPMVGKLYGANTLGAGVGAIATAGWWILGSVGLEGIVRIAACLNVGAGLLALSILSKSVGATAEPLEYSEVKVIETGLSRRPGYWILLYGLTGFVSLALEVVWFRLLSVLMWSTTYTFSQLLAIYLIFLGLGAMVGSRLSLRIKRAERVFLWLQFGIGLAAIVGPLVVVLSTQAYFAALPGTEAYEEAQSRLLWNIYRHLAAPLFVLSVPTFLMGICFPLVERLVAENVGILGKRTGALLFSNTAGAFLGTVVTGFFLLDVLGTPNTLLLLSLCLMLLGFYAANVFERGIRRVVTAALVVFVAGLSAVALPKGKSFWGPLQRIDPAKSTLAEDGTCVASLFEYQPNEFALYASGKVESRLPFSDFHVRLGAIPALLHPNPQEVLVIGLGLGSTVYGTSLDRRVGSMKTVEICAGQIRLLKSLRGRNVPEVEQLLSDPRIWITAQDGRKFLLDTTSRFDVVVTDTLRPRAAYAGNLYSQEFYEMVRRRLKPGGVFAQWIAGPRTLQTAASVFPHVSVLPAELGAPEPGMFVAGNSPIKVDPQILTERYAFIKREHLRPGAEQRLGAYIQAVPANSSYRNSSNGRENLNRDLFPRDEYSFDRTLGEFLRSRPR